MSYNITTWKTKKLKNFKIPHKAFFEPDLSDWHPRVKIVDDGKISLSAMDNDDIIGVREKDILHIHEINIAGEGSGMFVYKILTRAFEKSSGELEAVCIWEGGDSVSKLIVNDGKVKWEPIEL